MKELVLRRRVGVILGKMLDKIILERRDKLIEKGLTECKGLLGKQRGRNMYFFYEGSIEGFEECRNLNEFLDYELRLKELNQEELREIGKSSLKDEELRELYHLYNRDEETDINEVWKIKGRRTQINFVYERLVAFNFLVVIPQSQSPTLQQAS